MHALEKPYPGQLTPMRPEQVNLLASVSDEDTALGLYARLRDAGVRVWADGESVRAAPSNRLGAELRDGLRRHKADLLALLAPSPPFEFPIGWRAEWGLERDVLRRRLAACGDPADRAALAELVAAECSVREQWELLAGRLKALERELRARGALPPCFFPDGGSKWPAPPSTS